MYGYNDDDYSDDEYTQEYRLMLGTVDYYVGTIASGTLEDIQPILENTLRDYGYTGDSEEVMQQLLKGELFQSGVISSLELFEDN